jgi:hypothetical protein
MAKKVVRLAKDGALDLINLLIVFFFLLFIAESERMEYHGFAHFRESDMAQLCFLGGAFGTC